MKFTKLATLCLATASLSALVSCGSNNGSNGDSSNTSSKHEPVTYRYEDEEKYEKLWETKVVHNETCVMIEDDDGNFSSQLIYTPTRIVSVRDFTLNREIDSSEYRIEGNKIILNEGSSVRHLTKKNISCEEMPELFQPGNTYPDGKGGNILFTEGTAVVMYQINVTYEHNDTWQYAKPQKQGDKLPKLQNLLKTGDDIDLVVYGDSIFTGCNASAKLGIAPYQDTFPDAFKDQLEKKFGCNIRVRNTAVGGKMSDWGKANIENCVNTYNPNLVILGFGMNDGSLGVNPATYVDNMEFMIRSIQANCPNAEIIVCATILANPASSQNAGQAGYLAPLSDMVQDYDGVALMDMTTYSENLLKHKNSLELYANNINHPCDFMVRQYATNLLTTVEE